MYQLIDLGGLKIGVYAHCIRLYSTNSMGFTQEISLAWDEVPLLAVELKKLMESEAPCGEEARYCQKCGLAVRTPTMGLCDYCVSDSQEAAAARGEDWP